MEEDKFEYTEEGYRQAVKYLKKIGEWETSINNRIFN